MISLLSQKVILEIITLYGVESGKQEQTLDTRGKFTLSVAYVSRELITCI